MFVQNANFGAEKPLFFGKFRGKIKMLSTHNLFCKKFATFCQNSFKNLQCLYKNVNFRFCYFFDPRTMLLFTGNSSSLWTLSCNLGLCYCTVVCLYYHIPWYRSTQNNKLKVVSKKSNIMEERANVIGHWLCPYRSFWQKCDSEVKLIESFVQRERMHAVSAK